jgi:regulator of RNase E activity RraA
MEIATESRAMTPALSDALRHVTTGTTTMLLKKDIPRCRMQGPMPLQKRERLVGPACTLRFVSAREDLATPESWSKPISMNEETKAHYEAWKKQG